MWNFNSYTYFHWLRQNFKFLLLYIYFHWLRSNLKLNLLYIFSLGKTEFQLLYIFSLVKTEFRLLYIFLLVKTEFQISTVIHILVGYDRISNFNCYTYFCWLWQNFKFQLLYIFLLVKCYFISIMMHTFACIHVITIKLWILNFILIFEW